MINSRKTSPGLVAISSSAWMRAKAFAPPNCQAISPQSVRTTVPSGFVTGLPGEILLPTKTTRRIAGRSFTPASVITASIPANSCGDTPEKRWKRASIEWVLPPPKLVWSCTTGSPPRPESRWTAPTSIDFRLSVRYVRRKNSAGSRYSSVPSPIWTCQRSAANSAC